MEIPSHLIHSMALISGCYRGTRSLSGGTCGLIHVLAPVICQEPGTGLAVWRTLVLTLTLP